MDEISIYKKMSNLDNLKNYESVKSILNDICKDIMDYTKSSSVSIFLYNRFSQSLEPFIYTEEDGYSNINKIKITIDRSIMEKIIDEDMILELFGKINNIDKFRNMKIYDFLEEHHIKYLGCYKITMDNELIGCLNIGYKSEHDDKKIPNNFIKCICKMIGIIIRNYKLNQDIIVEHEKRIEVENELEDYLDVSSDIFTVCDLNGSLIKVSPGWKETFGWDLNQLIKNNFMACVYPEDIEKINQLIFSLLNNSKSKTNVENITIRHVCKDSNLKWIDWRIRYSERSNFLIAIGKDITQRIIEEERKKNLEEKVKLESVKNEFFANVSHEFKTPLNIILGTMQIMQRNIDNGNISLENLHRHTKGIRQNAYRLLRLVNNLIDISKMDIGYYNISLSNNNIVNIIEDITTSVVQYVESKDINLIFDTEEEEEIITACDPDAIERIVLNLLSNAIKYSSLVDGKIIVKVSRDKNNVIVSVKDNGVGIPEDKIGIIFDRFGQVNSNLTRKNEGSGIGLSLVQYLVELHNGNIRVESKLGEGSEFIFMLPIRTMEFDNKDNFTLGNRDFNIEKCKIEFADIYN